MNNLTVILIKDFISHVQMNVNYHKQIYLDL